MGYGVGDYQQTVASNHNVPGISFDITKVGFRTMSVCLMNFGQR